MSLALVLGACATTPTTTPENDVGSILSEQATDEAGHHVESRALLRMGEDEFAVMAQPAVGPAFDDVMAASVSAAPATSDDPPASATPASDAAAINTGASDTPASYEAASGTRASDATLNAPPAGAAQSSEPGSSNVASPDAASPDAASPDVANVNTALANDPDSSAPVADTGAEESAQLGFFSRMFGRAGGGANTDVGDSGAAGAAGRARAADAAGTAGAAEAQLAAEPERANASGAESALSPEFGSKRDPGPGDDGPAESVAIPVPTPTNIASFSAAAAVTTAPEGHVAGPEHAAAEQPVTTPIETAALGSPQTLSMATNAPALDEAAIEHGNFATLMGAMHGMVERCDPETQVRDQTLLSFRQTYPLVDIERRSRDDLSARQRVDEDFARSAASVLRSSQVDCDYVRSQSYAWNQLAGDLKRMNRDSARQYRPGLITEIRRGAGFGY